MSSEKSTIVAPGETKLTSMAEMWPMVCRKNKDGYWIDLRDITVGPFTSKGKAHQEAGLMQANLCGWTDPVNAKIYRDTDGWYVDRYFLEGPFETELLAWAHKQKLIKQKTEKG